MAKGAARRHTCTTARSSTDTELLDPPDFEKQIDFARCIAWQSSGATVISHPNFSTSHDLTHRRRRVDAA